jgi:transmembrane sensor
MDNHNYPTDELIWSLLAKKMANEALPEELELLHGLLIKNPELQNQVELLTLMWLQTPPINPAVSEAAYMRHLVNYKDEFFKEEIIQLENEEKEEKNSWWQRMTKKNILAWSTSIIVTGTALFFLFLQKNNDQPGNEALSTVTTKNGNRTKIVLPDGTQVWLNAGSELQYNIKVFNKSMREVSLNGEAYFDVVKNTEIPFVIHTKKMDLKVLGTSFNVRSYSNEKMAEASLITGSIEVTLKDRKNQKIILKPNEKISIASQEIENYVTAHNKAATIPATADIIPQIVVKELQPNPVSNIIGEIAWTQNKLFFENESLENMALLLERWFGKKILIQKESLKKVRYTGNFEKETLDEILNALQLSAPFRFKTENNSIVIF